MLVVKFKFGKINMAATSASVIGDGGDKNDAKDEAEEKLLEDNEVVILPRNLTDEVLSRSSKKVKLPEDGTAVGSGRFTIGPAPERDWEMVPPDGKWGWFILVGATLVNILIPGTIKSFGVLLVEFNDVFNASASASSGIVALCYFLYSSLGPISSILSVKWSYRTVTLIGGSFAAFGMIMSSWAFNISYLYFSFGAMVGTGAGLAFPPTVYIVTSYFVRLRGLANGICMSGSAFGSIILPPVLRLLLETYGYKGAVLILGGLMLNVWAAALLFRPVEEHMVRKYKDPDDEEQHQLESFPEEELRSTIPEQKYLNGSPIIQNSIHDSKPDSSMTLSKKQSINKINRISSKISNFKTSTLTLKSLAESKGDKSKLTVPKTPKKSPSSSSFQYLSTPFHGSTLSAFENPTDFTSQFSIKSVTNSFRTSCCKNQATTKEDGNKYFDVTLFKDPIYLIILISNCTSAISYTNFIILVPSYALECGFDKALGAYLLSIISALDLIGRIGGSAISDVVSTPKRYFFITGLLLSGISLAAIPLVSSYVALSVFCSFFGLASGINVGVTALVMTEMLGSERLMSSYGISLFVNGILQLIGPPLCGFWFEQTKSYKSLFITLGFVLVFGAALWSIAPFILKKRKAEGRDVNTA